MKRTTKKLAIVLVVVLLCVSIVAFASCGDKEKTYDVSIMLSYWEMVDGKLAEMVETWIFTPDISEMHVEREYDGKEYEIYVRAYMISTDAPMGGGKWIYNRAAGMMVFDLAFSRRESYSNWSFPDYICERGEYECRVRAEKQTSFLNEREICLYITVK